MWVVVMVDGGHKPVVWGPMEGKQAAAFAEFVTAEIDPAAAVPLADPVAELAGWREHIAGPAFARLQAAGALALSWQRGGSGVQHTAGNELADLLGKPYPSGPESGPAR